MIFRLYCPEACGFACFVVEKSTIFPCGVHALSFRRRSFRRCSSMQRSSMQRSSMHRSSMHRSSMRCSSWGDGGMENSLFSNNWKYGIVCVTYQPVSTHEQASNRSARGKYATDQLEAHTQQQNCNIHMNGQFAINMQKTNMQKVNSR